MFGTGGIFWDAEKKSGWNIFRRLTSFSRKNTETCAWTLKELLELIWKLWCWNNLKWHDLQQKWRFMATVWRENCLVCCFLVWLENVLEVKGNIYLNCLRWQKTKPEKSRFLRIYGTDIFAKFAHKGSTIQFFTDSFITKKHVSSQNDLYKILLFSIY